MKVNVNAAENMFHAARNYLMTGKKEKAAELFKKVKKDFPNSIVAREIDRWIAQASV